MEHHIYKDISRDPTTNLKAALPINSDSLNFYRCTVHSDIHTVHSPTDEHLLKI